MIAGVAPGDRERRGRRFGVALLLIGLSAAVGAPHAAAVRFENPAPITIPAGAPGTTMGVASPYPSTIAVSGLDRPITDVNVRLNQFTHTCGSDVDVLLVGPGGQKTILLSDAHVWNCLATAPDPDSITLDDEAATTYPCDASPFGSFKPTSSGPFPCSESGDLFAGPAPAGPYPASLAVFDGLVPDGTWSLFVYDHAGDDVGDVQQGWTLTLEAEKCGSSDATVPAYVRQDADDDVLIGTKGPDVFYAGGGDDVIRGKGGKDVICGGLGDDKLFGGSGNDKLRGEGGKDTLKGQGGTNDRCTGGSGRDKAARSCEKQVAIAGR